MVRLREDLHVNVPSHFRCPISLDVMKSPVSLCTGVTYDRSSIQQWLDSGHDTCPSTMQLLPSKDLVPNLTLRRLIRLWSSHHPLPPSPDRSRLLSALSNLEAPLGDLERSLSEVIFFSEESEENRKFLAEEAGDALPDTLLRLLCSPGMPLPTAGMVVRVLGMILKSRAGRADDLEGVGDSVTRSDLRWVDAVSAVLQGGGLPKESKIAAVKIVGYYSTAAASKVMEKDGLLRGILNQLREYSPEQQLDSSLQEACLSCLIDLSPRRQVKAKLIDLNLIGTVTKLLSTADLPVALTEKALRLVEAAASCREGRAAIGSECMEAVGQKLLKVSREATETSVRIMWGVWWLFGETEGREAVTARSNGLGKLLVVMQSECSPSVRRMCTDLVKVLRKWDDGKCWYSYDTNTTHIMPF
ncbi:hypothetical protein MLD38_036306 [Melastoma candidum]|uniref:Uncharacterized protein n=1 Tax=Melastoma candidum TaxID=119954 RepID=A0ACB9LL48_9MYRT|nr:hypothetical protein MLD38_036306 [Melastoma candidum]